MATRKKPAAISNVEARLDNLRMDAGVSRSLALWARYEGACEVLRWLGYKITVEAGKHRVEPC